MLLYLFFDSLLSTCPTKMEGEKWLKDADSPLPHQSPFIKLKFSIFHLYPEK